MILKILCDADWKSGLDKVLRAFTSTGYKDLFARHNYGTGLVGITIILMCRATDTDFKQRIRFARREKTFYVDIMLDLGEIQNNDAHARIRIVADRIASEISVILRKRAIPDFDAARFIEDLNLWLRSMN